MFAKLVALGVAAWVCVLGVAAPALADPVGGPKETTEIVKANSTDSYTIKLRGGETTRIRVTGDGDTCLELRVYDENGKLVASDTAGLGDRRVVYITPRWTGPFTVKVRNLGDVWNEYTITAD